jgi:hypothetical protein
MQSTVPGSCVVLGYFTARCDGGMSGSLACSELRILILTSFTNNGAIVLTSSRVQPLQLPASRFEAALTSQRWAAKLIRRSSGPRTHGVPRLPDIPLWHIDRPSTTLPLMAG